PPFCSISLTVASAPSRLTSLTTTRAPSRAMAIAAARPIPFPEPVTTTHLPLSNIRITPRFLWSFVQNDQSVDHPSSVLMDNQRIDIDFPNPRLITEGKIGQPHEQPLDLVRVRRFPSARSPQQRLAFQILHHFFRVPFMDRQDAQGNVLQDFDENASQSEKQRGAERFVAGNAENDLGARIHHFLDQDAVDL